MMYHCGCTNGRPNVSSYAEVNLAFSGGVCHCEEEATGNSIKEFTYSVRHVGLTMDNCRGQTNDGAGNMAGRYAGVLTLLEHQFAKFILLSDNLLGGN